MIAVRIRLLKF